MTIKKILTSIVLARVLVSNTTGYSKNIDRMKLKNYRAFVDLDGDGPQELVSGNFSSTSSYSLHAKFADSEGVYGESKLIYKTGSNGLANVEFSDLDGDGDIDLILGKYLPHGLLYFDYGTFVAENDGGGNFGEPKLINRIKKVSCVFD